MNELLAKFENVRSPTKTAHQFGIEEIIDPRDTRPLMCEVSRVPSVPGVFTVHIDHHIAYV